MLTKSESRNEARFAENKELDKPALRFRNNRREAPQNAIYALRRRLQPRLQHVVTRHRSDAVHNNFLGNG